MNSSQFNQVVATARNRQDNLLKLKGDDYTQHEIDRLSNFKRNAIASGLTTKQVWTVYFLKHIDAIMSYVKTGVEGSEPITGRLDDAINYLYLLEALIVEEDYIPTLGADDIHYVGKLPPSRFVNALKEAENGK